MWLAKERLSSNQSEYLNLKPIFLCRITSCEIMVTVSVWEAILNDKFKVYPAEESIYIASAQRANGPDKFVKFICDQLHPGDVPDNLNKLYIEAVYGSDAKVK